MMPAIKAIVCTDLNDALYYEYDGKHLLPSSAYDDVATLDRAILRKFLKENPPESNIIVGGVNTLKDMGKLLQDYKTCETDRGSPTEWHRYILADALRSEKDIIVMGGVSCYNMFRANYFEIVHVYCKTRLAEPMQIGRTFKPESLFNSHVEEVLYEDSYVTVSKLWETSR